jgi:hypothetical protein
MACERGRKGLGFLKEIRQLSKWMGANLDGVMKKQKEELGLIIEGLAQKAESQEMSNEEWKYIYKLERGLEEILAFEGKNLATEVQCQMSITRGC